MLRRYLVSSNALTYLILVLNLVPELESVPENTTAILDQLLDTKRYNKGIRPDFGGPPLLIKVNLLVNSFGSISETDQSYTMDIYFRQTWTDRRLSFSIPGQKELSLSWLSLDLVWKPDTFFTNGKKSHLHRITVPNKFLRVRYDGFITYSMRLTLKASCPMHLRRFPLDSQKCPLHISSYGYRRHDVMYAWCCSEHEKNVEVDPKVEIAQYDLINITTWGHKVALRGNSGKDQYSMLKAQFHLQRHTGFFMLQMYVPCGLIVCCSWVSFWIDPDDVPGRVALGVMTALSLTTLGFGGKAQMPKVSYPTALDWFVILCFSFVFATMVEYAAINFTDKLAKDLKKVKEKLLKKNSPPPPKQIPEDESTPGAVVETLGVPKEITRSLSVGNLPSSGITLDVPHPSTSRQPQDVPREEVVEEPFTKKEVTKKLNRGYYFGRIKKLEDKEIPMSPPLTRRIRRTTNATEGKYDPSDSPQFGGARGIPVITVTRRHSDGNVGDLSFDSTEYVPASAYEEMEFDNVLDRGPEDDFTVDYERSNIDRFASSTRRSFRKFVMKPVRMWQDVHFLPDPEDTSRQMMSGEPRAKFTVLDITSRRWFPLSFIFLQAIYWVAYMFYITDDFPEKQYKILRRVRT